MRDYAKFAPTFWTGPTGKAIRWAGRDAQVLACYLFTCPSSTMTGLYYLPLPTLCHEAGYTLEEAQATLTVLSDIGFAHYDPASELVWVVEAARYQIGDELKGGDKRIRGVCSELQRIGAHRYARAFYLKYRKRYSLPVIAFGKGLRRGLQGASKALRSHEKEQEKEQEQDNEHPPTPPAAQGGASGNGSDPATATLRAERLEARRRVEDLVEQARVFAVSLGRHPTREHLRTIRGWFRAGHTLARVQEGIEAGDHLPKARL